MIRENPGKPREHAVAMISDQSHENCPCITRPPVLQLQPKELRRTESERATGLSRSAWLSLRKCEELRTDDNSNAPPAPAHCFPLGRSRATFATVPHDKNRHRRCQGLRIAQRVRKTADRSDPTGRRPANEKHREHKLRECLAQAAPHVPSSPGRKSSHKSSPSCRWITEAVNGSRISGRGC